MIYNIQTGESYISKEVIHSECGTVSHDGELIKKVKILVEKYQTSDGTLHGSISSASFHEKKLKGTIKTCPNCNGTGHVDIYGDGRVKSTCNYCSGKGYVEKVLKWE